MERLERLEPAMKAFRFLFHIILSILLGILCFSACSGNPVSHQGSMISEHPADRRLNDYYVPPDVTVSENNVSINDEEKKKELFKLFDPKFDIQQNMVEGVLDIDKDFTTHQFAVVYDAITNLPENLYTALKLLVFSNYYGEAVSYPENASIYLGYGSTNENWSDDYTLATAVVHELGHVIEYQKGIEKTFRGICFDAIQGTWQRKVECNLFKDFPPQYTSKSGWDDNLRPRSAGYDGREDIANSLSYYVYGANLFRAEATKQFKMKEKYLFLKTVFGSKEYQCEIDGCPNLMQPAPLCNYQNGCQDCVNVNDPCTKSCKDCPALHSCHPAMGNCSTCYPGHSKCKYWVCENNTCQIDGNLK
jgi:hypothetical protein